MNKRTFPLIFSIAGLLLAALALKRGELAWLALPFLLYLGAGIWLSPEPEKLHFNVERKVSKTNSASLAQIDILVRVRNLGKPIERLTLYDPLPEGIFLSSGQNQICTALDKGGEAVLEYSFQAGRGSFHWDCLRAAASDPLSIVEIPMDLPASGELVVQPISPRFSHLPLHPHSTLHSLGSIPARLAGSGIDFWGVREYHPGDSLRWLDWRLTARHPRQFFTKEFEQEEIADIGLILDARQKAYLRVGENDLFELAVQAAAGLAETFSRQGHRLSLLATSDVLTMIYPGYGKVQLNRILHCLARLKPGENNAGMAGLPLRLFSSQALLLVISPYVHGDASLYPRLRAGGFQAVLISPDPFDLIEHSIKKGQSIRLALRAARLDRLQDLHEVSQLGIPVINWQTSQPLYPLVRLALAPGRGGFR